MAFMQGVLASINLYWLIISIAYALVGKGDATPLEQLHW